MAGVSGAAVPAVAGPAPERSSAVQPLHASAASQLAAQTDAQVEVAALRDEYSQTFANPDGSFTLQQSAAPQRVRAAGGSWVEPDATLVPRSDGSVGPRAAVVDLSFAGGPDGLPDDGGGGSALLRLARNGESFTLGWPSLPSLRRSAPQLFGESALYLDVLPGVDLRLTASTEGYQQVLVVKNREAALNPDLRQLKFDVRTEGLRLIPVAGGGLRAVDRDGESRFNGSSGLMWDSSGDSTAAQLGGQQKLRRLAGSDGEAGPPPINESAGVSADDPADGPSPGDRAAELPVRVADAAVSVTPDAALLSNATYPVYIDPPVGLSATKRTMVTSNGQHLWQFSNAHDSETNRDRGRGVGHCSHKVIGNVAYTCSTSPFTSRIFFSFDRKKLAGKIVLDATFRVTETWSFSCEPSWVRLYRTKSDISAATRWPGPATADLLGDRKVSHGRGSACSPSQPNAPVEFNDNPDEKDENLTSTVKNLANGKWSRLTVMLRAADEDDPNSWKRFKNDATLQVTYFPAPGVPTAVGVQANNNPKSTTCPDSGHPVTVADPAPRVRGTVQTLVQPGKDESKGSLRATFQVEGYDAATKKWSSVWSTSRPSSGYDPDGTGETTTTSALADGKSYRLHAKTVSHGSFAGKSQDPGSQWSAWCYFKVNSAAPKAPQVDPELGSPYKACRANDCPALGGPGIKGSFTFKPDAADADITGYRWRLASPSDDGSPDWSTKPREVEGKTVTVSDVKPPFAGTLVLSVEARDLPGRYGPPQTFEFNVAPAAGAVGRWQFTESAGTTTADAATEGVRHAMTTSGNATFDPRGRRGDRPEDHALAVNGTSAYAATSEPVVNTAESFTVSAWAYLTNTTRAQSVASQSDATGSGFNLAYQPATGWVFAWHRAPAGQPATVVRSFADTKSATSRVWTHVAGTYDAAARTIQLVLNGRPQGAPTVIPANAVPTTTTGGLQIGRGGDGANATTDYLAGMIDEVQVWGRELTGEELRQNAQLIDANGQRAISLAGAWSADQGVGTTIPDASGHARPAMALATGAILNDADMIAMDGVAGYAGAAGPVVDETGSFTVTTRVAVDASKLATKPPGYAAQVVGQQVAGESSWGLWYQQDAVVDGVPQGRWHFGRTAVDGSTGVQTTVVARSIDFADVDNDPIVQLTGVYSAQDDTMRLYVNEEEQTTDDGDPVFPFAQQGAGELSLGRGRAATQWGRYLPGQIGELRIWAGAMTREQIYTHVLGGCADCEVG